MAGAKKTRTTKKTEPKNAKSLPKTKVRRKKADVPPKTGKSIQLDVVGTDGKAKGKISVPAALFEAKINPAVMAQAVRVYLANQREGSASTKTRSEVSGSTRKIYRQKGTGRARHGAIRAPIFIGGGIAHGPKPREFRRRLPKNMRRAALAAALTSKRGEGGIVVVDGLASLRPKTKDMVNVLTTVGATETPLLIVPPGADTVIRAARNIDGIEIVPAQNLHTYAVLQHPKLVFMKEALPVLSHTFAAHHERVQTAQASNVPVPARRGAKATK